MKYIHKILFVLLFALSSILAFGGGCPTVSKEAMETALEAFLKNPNAILADRADEVFEVLLHSGIDDIKVAEKLLKDLVERGETFSGTLQKSPELVDGWRLLNDIDASPSVRSN